MKLYRFIFILILPLLASCTYDYDFEEEFTPSIVVNSTITPDSTIKVYLYWSKHVEDTSNYKKVERFTAKLYQNGVFIPINEEGVNGLLSTSVYPKEGLGYRLEIDVPNYGQLSAETSIPPIPTIGLEYTGAVGSTSGYGRHHHFNIDKIELGTTTRSVMIRSTEIFEKIERDPETWEELEPTGEITSRTSYYLYANNPFCDQFNVVIDMYSGSSSVSSYDSYIRIPEKNIHLTMPLKFSISDFSSSYPEPVILDYDDFGYPIYKLDDFGYRILEHKENKDSLRIEVISPSDDYDMFHKSEYVQYMLSDAAIFSETRPVHTNIKNGLGCFMGYSSRSKTYKIEYDN